MLLEQLMEKARQSPAYDWDQYYCWFFSRLADREVSGFRFWQCPHCQQVALLLLPARSVTCRHCGLVHLLAEADG